MKQQLKSQHDDVDCDSRMDDRPGGERQSNKKSGKSKGIRGSSKSGGSSSFWKQWDMLGEQIDDRNDTATDVEIVAPLDTGCSLTCAPNNINLCKSFPN